MALKKRTAWVPVVGAVTPERRRLARLCRLANALIAPFVKLEVRGNLTLANERPFLGGANHRSLADLLIGMAAFHRLNVQPQILFKESFLPGPLSRFARRAGVIVVGGEGATAAGVKALDEGNSLMIMIEGGLFWDASNPYALGNVKSGIARMARTTGRPMVPLAVDGTERLWPKGSFPRLNPFRRKSVTVTVGASYVPTDENDQLEAETFGETISDLLQG